MINHTDKTIPYRLSPAELENLRLLRKRRMSSDSIEQDEEEKKISQEINAWNSLMGRSNQGTQKKLP